MSDDTLLPTMQAADAARLVLKGTTVWTLDAHRRPERMSESWARAIRGYGFHVVASTGRARLVAAGGTQ